uniref:Uncharacterized protein n=1 Tax=Opuntia streptacantha TaxID=393608 RepID=A0A7C9DZ99_OPUST
MRANPRGSPSFSPCGPYCLTASPPLHRCYPRRDLGGLLDAGCLGKSPYISPSLSPYGPHAGCFGRFPSLSTTLQSYLTIHNHGRWLHLARLLLLRSAAIVAAC